MRVGVFSTFLRNLASINAIFIFFSAFYTKSLLQTLKVFSLKELFTATRHRNHEDTVALTNLLSKGHIIFIQNAAEFSHKTTEAPNLDNCTVGSLTIDVD